jgi:hypothetical protein
MEPSATNMKNVRVSNDQSYEWGIVESKFGKIRRYAVVDYHFYGEGWRKVIEAMKQGQMRQSSLNAYRGAQIDPISKAVRLRGHSVRDYVFDKHFGFWCSFFKCNAAEKPQLSVIGKIVRLPNIAGDNDSLNFFIDGQNVNELLTEPDEGMVA